MTRSDFLKLTSMDAEALKSLVRRDQLPFRTDSERDRKLGEYTLFEAFLTILTNDLSSGDFGLNRTAACNIVTSFALRLYRLWPEIGTTAASLNAGHGAEDEVLCGRIYTPGLVQPVPFCELTSKFGGLVMASAPVVRIIATSASRGMTVLMRRAARHGIDLPKDLFMIRWDVTADGTN